MPNDLSAWDAKLHHIVISAGHDYWGKGGEGRLVHGTTMPEQVRCVTDMGLEGDRYFGKKPGGRDQVTFMSCDVIEQVRDKFRLPNLPPSVFRRNLIVSGVELGDWLGKSFTFQGVTFEGSQECKPCQWMDRVIAPGGQAFLKTPFYGGLRARVLSDGELRIDA
jgi:MOSC domain-containing protein YiiM